MYYEENFIYDSVECPSWRSERSRDREEFNCRCRERDCRCNDHDRDRDRDRDKDCDRCKGCVCNQLKHLHPGVKVKITTDELDDLEEFTFSNFDKKTCCAYFADNDEVLVVDCRDLKAIKFKN